MARTSAPSDLSELAEAAAARIGGRVMATSADGRRLRIADAFAIVDVALASPDVVAAPGDLVVVEGAREGATLAGARIVERHAPAQPPSGIATESGRLITRGVGRHLAARADAIAAVRRYFDGQRFLEVDTPAVVPSPGLDLHLDAFAVDGGPLAGGGYLVTSPEYQMKRLLVGGVPRCYELARCFRRGEVGARHNPEFLMLEWYRAFAAVDEVMTDTEQVVRAVARRLGGAEALVVEGRRIELVEPFERIAVGEAFHRFAGVAAADAIALATTDEDRYYRLLVESVEPALAELPRPVFLVDYPAPHASLARLSPSDPRVAERFELYVGGVELCNGFGELTDPNEQRARLERDRAERARTGKPVYPVDERFVAALEEGMPPAAGNALGLDRLVALAVGAARVADVLAFPVEWL